jgi:hypothetical protein
MKVIFEYSNPHPKEKLTTDCVVRAIALATESDYLETRRHLNRIKKNFNETSYKKRTFIHKYAKYNNWKKISFPAIKGVPRLRGRDFVKQYPTGTYILNLAKHIVAVVDGVYLDTWDSTDKMIYNAWQVESGECKDE